MKCFTPTLVGALLLSFVASTLANDDPGQTISVQLDANGFFDVQLSANLNGGDIPLPALKAQPDPGANFIVVGDSLTEYLNGLGFVLDEDSNLYKVKCSDGPTLKAKIGDLDLPIPNELFYIPDPANPDECYTILKKNEKLVQIDGEADLSFGTAVLSFLQASSHITFSLPNEDKIAEVKALIEQLISEELAINPPEIVTVQLDENGHFDVELTATLNEEDTDLPPVKAQLDPEALLIVVGPSLAKYLDTYGFVLDNKTQLYKVKCSDGPSVEAEIGGHDFPIPIELFYIKDLVNPGECYSLLQHDETKTSSEGGANLLFGQAVIYYFNASITDNQISLTVPNKTMIAEMKVMVEELADMLASKVDGSGIDESGQTVTVDLDENGYLEVQLTASLNGEDKNLPPLKAIPDSAAMVIGVGPSLSEYLDEYGFFLDIKTKLYKVKCSDGPTLKTKIGNMDFPIPSELFYIPDLEKPDECYSLLQYDETLIHPEGEKALILGQAILTFFDAQINDKQISLTVPSEAKIAEMKAMLAKLAGEQLAIEAEGKNEPGTVEVEKKDEEGTGKQPVIEAGP